MKKLFVISVAVLLSLFTFTRCNHENGGENENENVDQCAVVDFDGNCYDTVHIGDQVWMKSNLRTTHFCDGSLIPLGGNDTSATAPYRYEPSSSSFEDNVNFNYDSHIHGLYYNAAAVHDSRGLCPSGWHVASDADWNELGRYVLTHYETYFGYMHNYVYDEEAYEEFVEETEDFLNRLDEIDNANNWGYPINKALVSQSGWNWESDNSYFESWEDLIPENHPELNNTTGFSAYPAGNCWGETFWMFGLHAIFWTSTSYDDQSTIIRSMWPMEPCVDRGVLYNGTGLSVRCVRD